MITPFVDYENTMTHPAWFLARVWPNYPNPRHKSESASYLRLRYIPAVEYKVSERTIVAKIKLNGMFWSDVQILVATGFKMARN